MFAWKNKILTGFEISANSKTCIDANTKISCKKVVIIYIYTIKIHLTNTQLYSLHMQNVNIILFWLIMYYEINIYVAT